MGGFLCVGAGGALGAMGRYGVSLLPLAGLFPVWTLAVNFLGAVLIGLLSGLAESRGLAHNWQLFWKTGVCGGFTTFSTFSLESWDLWRNGHPGLAAAYVALSLALCIAGVVLGHALGRLVCGK